MSQSTRYLCFNLGNEEFAIPLLAVREVLAVPEITSVPQMPPHFLGIMNLRGQVISVMDLRLKLGIKPTKADETAVIILDMGDLKIGMAIDHANSVHDLADEEKSDRPSLTETKANDYIVGVFKKQDHLVLILDVAKALSISDQRAAMSNSTHVA